MIFNIVRQLADMLKINLLLSGHGANKLISIVNIIYRN